MTKGEKVENKKKSSENKLNKTASKVPAEGKNFKAPQVQTKSHFRFGQGGSSKRRPQLGVLKPCFQLQGWDFYGSVWEMGYGGKERG